MYMPTDIMNSKSFSYFVVILSLWWIFLEGK